MKYKGDPSLDSFHPVRYGTWSSRRFRDTLKVSWTATWPTRLSHFVRFTDLQDHPDLSRESLVEQGKQIIRERFGVIDR